MDIFDLPGSIRNQAASLHHVAEACQDECVVVVGLKNLPDKQKLGGAESASYMLNLV
jgi:hypothetical protein